MRKLIAAQGKMAKAGKLGPVARLVPTTATTTLRKDHEPAVVIDGPFAETKKQRRRPGRLGAVAVRRVSRGRGASRSSSCERRSGMGPQASYGVSQAGNIECARHGTAENGGSGYI